MNFVDQGFRKLSQYYIHIDKQTAPKALPYNFAGSIWCALLYVKL